MKRKTQTNQASSEGFSVHPSTSSGRTENPKPLSLKPFMVRQAHHERLQAALALLSGLRRQTVRLKPRIAAEVTDWLRRDPPGRQGRAVRVD
ncbi:hypothetical protein [Thiocystis violascens]|uniref:hypothetical protein n=1 Tax=Thiocystis violascens TaxID=73141 RepID=UPI00145EAE8E|nr:hypothetical protein [Thiocystis violascens]